MNRFSSVKSIILIAKKDIAVEIRRKYEVFSMITFAFISVLVASFSLGPFFPYANDVVPSLIWIILLFTAMLGFNTTFTREMEQGTINGLRLLPISYSLILIGKILYGFLLVAVIELFVIPLSIVLFGYSLISHPLLVIFVFILGTLGLAIVGAMVSGLTMYTESRTILAPLLTFPLVLPIIIPSATLTKKLVTGVVFSLDIPELRIILLSIVALGVATAMMFRFVFTD